MYMVEAVDPVLAAAMFMICSEGEPDGPLGAAFPVDSSASAVAIEDRILRRSPSHRDILVVYLSGHGYALREGDGWEWYFLPFTDAWGGREAREAPKDAIRRHGLSSRRLMKMLTGTEARHVFLVLDSCRSGAVVDAVAASPGRAFDDAAGQKALHRIARVGGIHVLGAYPSNGVGGINR